MIPWIIGNHWEWLPMIPRQFRINFPLFPPHGRGTSVLVYWKSSAMYLRFFLVGILKWSPKTKGSSLSDSDSEQPLSSPGTSSKFTISPLPRSLWISLTKFWPHSPSVMKSGSSYHFAFCNSSFYFCLALVVGILKFINYFLHAFVVFLSEILHRLRNLEYLPIVFRWTIRQSGKVNP